MTNAEKIISPDAKQPDKFQSTKPWKTRVFRYSGFGALIGAVVFGFIGTMITSGNVQVPMSSQSSSVAWPFVLAIGFAGFILSALIGGLVALYTRDIRTHQGKGA